MTDLAHYEDPSAALVNDQRYMDRIPAMAEQLSKSNLCPEAFRGKANDIAIIGYAAADLGLRLTLTTLPQYYVIHGRVGMMAQLQAGLAGRAGYDVRPVSGKCDERSATVRVVDRLGHAHEVGFTIEEAKAAGMVSKDSMYEKWPASMLVARATTRAISWHCPEAKLGLAGTADMAEVEAIDAVAHDGPAVESGEAASERERRRFRALLTGLDADEKPEVFAHLKAEGIPPPTHPDLTSAQAQRAEELIYETQDQRSAATSEEPSTDPDDDVAEGEVVPDGAHDDAPEASGYEDADDPGRMF